MSGQGGKPTFALTGQSPEHRSTSQPEVSNCEGIVRPVEMAGAESTHPDLYSSKVTAATDFQQTYHDHAKQQVQADVNAGRTKSKSGEQGLGTAGEMINEPFNILSPAYGGAAE